ncbi:alpha/beta hydrolase [Actinacidiphila sp. bgisy167]|uniref:alpha/beta hydrolase n=1 Tax=Actinacidiphila sp. bgisy167 TaxID=3413797 RepID=UPI003D73945F
MARNAARSRKTHTTVAALAATAVLLTACTATGPPRGASPHAAAPAARAAAGAASTPDPSLDRYYRQRLYWAPCAQQPSFECTTLTVPLDYAHPRSGDITVAATRLKATGPKAHRAGSLQFNPGGPGQSAMNRLWALADGISPALRAAYDLVALDPRGVGHSTPVTCGPGATPGAVRTLPATAPGDVAAWDAAYRQVAAACQDRAGRLLPHVGTQDTARDMDVLRALLGDRHLHYLGVSYGTYLGTTYARLFPSRVGRMVLDGAVDPALDGYRSLLDSAKAYQAAWHAFAADCATRPHCPLGDTPQQADHALDTLRTTLNRSPLRAGKDISVTGDDVISAVMTALRTPAWNDLRAALADAEDGRTTALQRLLADRDTSGGTTDALLAIGCLSATLSARLTAAQTAAALPRFRQASPQFGDFVAALLPACAHWPAPPTQFPQALTDTGGAPVLVVGTTGDPTTPYAWAKALTRRLPTARLLTYDGAGHTAYQQGSACVHAAVDRYLLHGRLPSAPAVCT